MDLQSSLRNIQSEDADGDNSNNNNNSNNTEPPSPEGSILTFVLFLVQVAVIYAVLRTCIIRCRNIQQRRNRRNPLEMLSDEADHPFSDDVVVLRNRSKMKHAIRVILDSYTVPFSRRDELLLLQKNPELESTNKGMFRSLNLFSRSKERDHDDADVEMGIHNEGSRTVEPIDATNKILEPCSKSDVFEEQSELICPICLDEYEPNDQVCSKGCNHLYHRDCLEQWLHQKGHNCPYCRKTMISDAELAQHI